MKKFFSIFLAVTLILCSFSFVFADFTTTDSSNLATIKNSLITGGALYGLVSTISSRLQYNNITVGNLLYNMEIYLGRIQNYLYIDSTNTIGKSVYNIEQAVSGLDLDISDIVSGLIYTDGNGSKWPWLMDVVNNLDFLRTSLTNYYSGQTTLSQANRRANGHQNFFSSSGQWIRNIFDSNGDLTSETFLWQNGTPLGNIFGSLRGIGDSTAYGFNKLLGQMNAYPVYDDPSDYTSRYFNGISFADVALDQLGSIDMFIARLGYVLASDERIEAQEAAAPIEEAVVDNFIDSSGSGAASTNDIGAVSDLSAGYKENFSSDASVSGIFDLFNSDHMGWFSNETKNQLDTTSNQRSKSSTYETPLLDKQIQDIYDSLGVKMP